MLKQTSRLVGTLILSNSGNTAARQDRCKAVTAISSAIPKRCFIIQFCVFRLMVAIFGPMKNQSFEQIIRDVPIAN